MTSLPLVVELTPVPDVETALAQLASMPHSVLLDSASRDRKLGSYSFLTADPFDFVTLGASDADCFGVLESRLRAWPSTTRDDLPPFQGGAVALLSYELAQSLERLPSPRFDEFQMPRMAVGLYDTVLAMDHVQQRAWLISHGFPETTSSGRLRRAKERIEQFQAWLSEAPGEPCCNSMNRHAQRLAAHKLAPQFPVAGPAGLTSNFSADGYRAAVQRAIDYIHAGDVFQVNLSQRLLFPANGSSLDLYLRLRRCNPAPFAGWFDLGEEQIVSASPERFLSVRGARVEARPIKGTRRRVVRGEVDLFAGDDLLESEKDRAENVMIVDLLRNDLSRVCEADSVRVTQLCGLETYQFVQHLVSVVEGQLSSGKTAVDLVRGAFPGGSITGAPKIRAMEIIAELEPTARGPYCGALGYFGFDGSADLNILIRTITASRGWWQFPVGGGIVAQSSPEREYEETWHKAEGLLRALT
jgi:para-aminobenzoate synthetase component I